MRHQAAATTSHPACLIRQILVDDTARVHLRVESLHGEENILPYVTDNTGLKLFAYLRLADYLTGCGYFSEVFFQTKWLPVVRV